MIRRIKKHQKGSELIDIINAKIDKGLFSGSDERTMRKATKYIDPKLYYFANPDGTYSVMQAQPDKVETDATTGEVTTTEQNPEITTNAVGLRSNTSPLSLKRLGLGDNRGARKIANAMGYLNRSGDLQQYQTFLDKKNKAKEDEAAKKKAEEEGKNFGKDSNIATEDLADMSMADQDTKFTTDIANIKKEDVKYKTVTREEAEAMYFTDSNTDAQNEAELNQLTSIPGAGGITMYQVPYVSIGTGGKMEEDGSGGTTQEFSLTTENGKFVIGAPLPFLTGGTSKENPSADMVASSGRMSETYTGSDAAGYQTHLAKLVNEKLEAGDITEAQLREAGIDINNLFKATKGTEVTYGKILNQIGAATDRDVNSSGQQVSRDAGSDGSFSDLDGSDDKNLQGRELKTKVDGQLGAATKSLEDLLKVTRPTNLTQAKKSSGSGGGSEDDSGGGNWLKESLATVKALKIGGKASIRKKGGISFTILNHKF